jgi:hypothetical protein
MFYHRGHGEAQRKENILMVTGYIKTMNREGTRMHANKKGDKYLRFEISKTRRWIPACAGMTRVGIGKNVK